MRSQRKKQRKPCGVRVVVSFRRTGRAFSNMDYALTWIEARCPSSGCSRRYDRATLVHSPAEANTTQGNVTIVLTDKKETPPPQNLHLNRDPRTLPALRRVKQRLKQQSSTCGYTGRGAFPHPRSGNSTSAEVKPCSRAMPSRQQCSFANLLPLKTHRKTPFLIKHLHGAGFAVRCCMWATVDSCTETHHRQRKRGGSCAGSGRREGEPG